MERSHAEPRDTPRAPGSDVVGLPERQTAPAVELEEDEGAHGRPPVAGVVHGPPVCRGHLERRRFHTTIHQCTKVKRSDYPTLSNIS